MVYYLDQQNGTIATERFSIGNVETLGAITKGANGNYELLNGATGEFNWLLIPYSSAAPKESTPYFIGGNLKYTIAGEELDIDLQPALITVDPDPSLRIHYFWEKHIEADDPFTDPIEPSTPFTIGMAIQNAGYGTASNVKLASGQPEIIENEKGLKINFRLIGSSIGNMQRESDLSIDFGDLEPMITKVAHWWLITTLQGTFKNYSATVSNKNPLGDEDLSLIDDLQIHDLIGNVKLYNVNPDEDFDDTLDFLTNDVEDMSHMPDHVYSSNDLSVFPVKVGIVNMISSSLEEVCIAGACNNELIITLNRTTIGASHGWTYYQIATEDGDDIGINYFTRVIELSKICKNDTSASEMSLPFENAWIKTIPKGDPRITYHYVNLFDYDSMTNESCYYKITTCGRGSNVHCKDRSGIELIDPYAFLRRAVNGCLSDPPDPPNNVISNFTFSNTILEQGDVVKYVCIDNGFTFYSTCMENGNWSNIQDECDSQSTTSTTTTMANDATTTTTTVTTTINVTTTTANNATTATTTANNATTTTTANNGTTTTITANNATTTTTTTSTTTRPIMLNDTTTTFTTSTTLADSTTTTSTTTTTTTEYLVECNSEGGTFRLTDDYPCISICSPRYPKQRDYPAGKTVKWKVKPNANCTGGTKVTFAGPIFHLPKSNNCKRDDYVLFKQRKINGDVKIVRKCGKWNPIDEPDREKFALKNPAKNIAITFNSRLKQRRNGAGFMAQLCGIQC